ncbi:MAG: AtpZ/AtpI family protein [Acidobacteriia bacterium]|nr:AtpZ/AtpI family protein [Terriglobia bacterium]
MPDRDPTSPPKLSPAAERLLRQVESKQQRMMSARGRSGGAWDSIAILGTIGWSVVAPTLVGVALGVWIDSRWPSRFSWALILMLSGLMLGSANAWLRIRGDQP